jgi:hypothetical protein
MSCAAGPQSDGGGGIYASVGKSVVDEANISRYKVLYSCFPSNLGISGFCNTGLVGVNAAIGAWVTVV